MLSALPRTRGRDLSCHNASGPRAASCCLTRSAIVAEGTHVGYNGVERGLADEIHLGNPWSRGLYGTGVVGIHRFPDSRLGSGP